MGSQEPSARIAPAYDHSDGMDASKIMAIGGLYLDPWQSDVIDDWMGRAPSGRWAAPTCGGAVPRQNGKTLLLQARAVAGMILFNEQIIYTAHLQKTATETFEELRDFFEGKNLKKYVKEIKSALGREQIILKSGARIKFLARTRNGGRGQHGDLLIIDEAQEIDEAQQASFLPALSASQNPQTIYTGTPPDPTAVGTVFRQIRGRALSGDSKKTAWFEYSVDEIGDVKDKQRWADTNPALGRRILLSTIESEMEQMDPDTFARERLGWWTPVDTSKGDLAIDAETWDACATDDPRPDGKLAFGVRFTSDGSEVALCAATMPTDGGPIRISLIRQESTALGIRWLSDWLNERYKDASCVVVDGRNGVDVLCEQLQKTWRYKGSVIRPTAKEVIAGVSMLTDGLSEHAVTWYRPQEALRDSAITSTRRPIIGGWGFGGENSGPIEAAALAIYGVKTSKRDPHRKMRIG